MSVGPGTRLGVYEVTAQIGEGGMGQVYRATDTRLKRQVAIKILPPSLAADHGRLARFQREAEILASLNHPNIAAIYGLEDGAGVTALVMELIEGEDLSQQIRRAAIPLDEALRIAKQIAEALEAAHEQGIVHRDLKPANIKVRADGTVKVLDFGLAKALTPEGAGATADATHSPTITSPAMTQAGLIMGTAAYMSPEQAAGKPVDRRADVWAFGVVLWEMLTGRRLFGGETVAHTLADVLRSSIEFDTMNAPAPIANLLRRCLDRDAKTRLRDIGEARVAIVKFLADPASGTATPRQSTPSASQWMGWVTATVLAVIAATGWLRARPEAPAASPAGADFALTIAPTAGSLTPVGDLHATPEISPDGSAVIYYRDIVAAGNDDGIQVRRLNAYTPEPVRTGGFRNPGFWSPDSRSFAFNDGVNLKKMRLPDGAPEVISSGLSIMVGGSWSDKGTLLVSGAVNGRPGLFAVPATGGVLTLVELPFVKNSGFFYWPEFLPDGEDFLIAAPASKLEESEIYLATLREGRAVDSVLLMKNGTAVRYTPAGGGRLLFVRNNNLYAQTLNRTTRSLEREPQLIQQGVASSPSFNLAHFSVSRTGVIAWRPGAAGLSQVTILDRQGKELGTTGPPTVVQTMRLAPDETRLFIGFNGTGWLLEPGRPGRQQLEEASLSALWSTDGSKLLATNLPDGAGTSVVERSVTGSGTVRELAKLRGFWRLEDLSTDGKTLLLNRGPLDTSVFALALDGGPKDPTSLVQTGETISHAHFSPDGRWIMYAAAAAASNERGGIYSGGIYVQPFPGPGLRKQVTSRGNYPVWRGDGKEIVYFDKHQNRDYIWSVPLTARGADLEAGTPQPLFPARLPATTYSDLGFLAVSRDGSRFFVPQAVEQPESEVIHLRAGWAR